MKNSCITPADLAGKGVVGLPDVPGLSAREMQRKLDELALDVLAPKHNALIDALAGPAGAAAIGLGETTVAGHAADLGNPHAVTAAQTGAYTAAETDAAIAARIVDIGSADMAKAVYDRDGDGVVDDAARLGGKPARGYAGVADAFSEYTHTFSAGVHTLTGSGDNIKFAAIQGFSDGDRFEVNGEACDAITAAGEALGAGAFAAGAVVGCFRRGNRLNFRAGGGGLRWRLAPVADLGDLPKKPERDTIFVAAPYIGAAVFCAHTPDAAAYAEGTVWVCTGSNAATRLCLAKSAKIQAWCDPVGVCVLLNGRWTPTDAAIGKGDAWVLVGGELVLLDGADICADRTGGYRFIKTGGGWYFNGAAPGPYTVVPHNNGTSGGTMGAMITAAPVDLTGIRLLIARITGVTGYGGSVYGGPNNFLFITDKPDGFQNTAAAAVNDTAAARHDIGLDVERFSGKYYIGLGTTQVGTASNGFEWHTLRGVR